MLCTKEEVLEITNWCKDHHFSYKKRLEQLNLKPYQFYDARDQVRPLAIGRTTSSVGTTHRHTGQQ